MIILKLDVVTDINTLAFPAFISKEFKMHPLNIYPSSGQRERKTTNSLLGVFSVSREGLMSVLG